MKTIKDLLNTHILSVNADIDVPICGISLNTKTIKKGELFFALKDNTYVREAYALGASAVVTEEFLPDIPCVAVKNIRRVLSEACKNFYDDPAKDMCIIGVVGTNGKTTTTHIISHILRAAGRKNCLIGTLGYSIDGEAFECAQNTNLTTPDPHELWRILAAARDNNIKYAVMEISAHAIFFEKLHGLKVDVCAFTNLSRDHLDFFGDMRRYGNVKKSFFTDENVKLAVINADDDSGREILNSKKVCAVSYGLKQPADCFAIDIGYGGGKTNLFMNVIDEIVEMSIPLSGEFNVYNALAAVAVAKSVGISANSARQYLKSLPPVDGRFNVISGEKTAIIDYAHTPDGLEKILSAARALTKKRVIAVFGCGGNRDRTKRPIMGKIASQNSDLCILTSDNPRFEEPESIIEEIAAGIDLSVSPVKITDRKTAIEYAFNAADADDIIVIAGKGGEPYIDVMGEKIPYSDRETCENILGV